MNDNKFNDVAKSLAGSPLGVIALFIVLVYGMASLVVTAETFQSSDRTPIIYFITIFPVVVLLVFIWLVTKHYDKLFGPSDFKNEDNFIKMQMMAAASLSVASAKSGQSGSDSELHLDDVFNTVRSAYESARNERGQWRNHILWVDDNPDNNTFERKAFESIVLRFTLAQSTDEALERIRNTRFSAVISDMGRREGPREGYVLLDKLRSMGNNTPLFFYASSNEPKHKQETLKHGGQGCTNHPQELFSMVTKAIIQQ